jgi:hypothetical protein
MRLTLKEFKHEYKVYKNDKDLELLIQYNRTTYAKLEAPEEEIEEGWSGVVLEEGM